MHYLTINYTLEKKKEKKQSTQHEATEMGGENYQKQ